MPKMNPLHEISAILMITLIVLTFLSFSSEKLSVFNFELKKSGIKDYLLAKAPSINENNSFDQENGIAKNDSLKVAKAERIMDTMPQRILMVGESMIEGLMFPFKKYAKFNNHHLRAKIWYGSRFEDWAKNDTLKKVIESYQPTFIMISVGSNELYVRNIENRDTFVKSIVQQLGDHKFVWIGPPIPKKDNGISQLITQNVGEDRYFVSKHMKFKRKKDGVHPVSAASYVWADSIALWIMDKSRYPVLLKDPAKEILNDSISVEKRIAAN